MRKYALMGLFAFAFFASISPKASAESLAFIKLDSREITVSEPVVLASISAVGELGPVAAPAAVPAPVKYVVAQNDSLSKIAEAHGTTWKRLFDKNVAISNPDLLIVGVELVIPTAEEVLTDRTVVEPPKPVVPKAKTASARTAVAKAPGSSAGNRYTAGYCTWYVKNLRPDLPNNLGNASTWVSRAAAQGLATGSTPRVGAVGQAGNHVVYVQAVNGDGTVTISEMNHAGLYVTTYRTLPASYFSYIY